MGGEDPAEAGFEYGFHVRVGEDVELAGLYGGDDLITNGCRVGSALGNGCDVEAGVGPRACGFSISVRRGIIELFPPPTFDQSTVNDRPNPDEESVSY